MKTFNTRRLARLCAAASALGAVAAGAVPVSAVIDGLPPGLSTRLIASKITCGSFTPRIDRFAGVPMAENSFTVFDTVVGVGGITLLRPRIVTTYSAQADFSDRGCDGTPTQLQFSVDVDGERTSASPVFRTAGVSSSTRVDGSIRVATTLRGFSQGLVSGPAGSLAPFVQFTRGIFNRVVVSHSDPFGAASVAAPVLELVLPSPTAPRGFAVSTRLFITSSGEKCIRAQFTTRCQTSGILSHGGVDLSTDSTEHRPGSRTSASGSTFVFKLSNSFPIGTYTLNAWADDVDPFDYLVDGVPTELDLIKWTPVTQSVVIQ